MKQDFRDFIETLTEGQMKEIIMSSSKNGKIKKPETIMIFLKILEKYHDWLND